MVLPNKSLAFHKKMKCKRRTLTKRRRTQTKRRRTQTKRRRTQTNKKMNIRGGDRPNLGAQIGQGSHGTIFILEDDPSFVVKIFQNRSMRRESLCKKIIERYNNVCDEVSMEYVMQEIIREGFEKHPHFPIHVPKASNFETAQRECFYKMERIYPLSGYEELLLPDMTVARFSSPRSNKNLGRTMGYEEISEILDISPQQLAGLIGQMFHILQFELNVDGYDCELILGRTSERDETPKLFLIDFDKVNCFVFDLHQELYRKESEERFYKYEITNPKRMASWLYSSMFSMSLLPTDPVLKESFIHAYCNENYRPKNAFELETIEFIKRYIDDYATS